ncbi:MAG: hypothetical protein HY897_01725 [Deltaproteobacteria bacterium]|nr:hypothetical protein [Deltaproteobacteria bacterium]
MYLFDWAEVDDEGVRFENLVALHLLKAVSTWKALGSGDIDLSEHIPYFQEKLGVPAAIQVVHKSGILRKLRKNDRVQWIVSADRWLRTLP